MIIKVTIGTFYMFEKVKPFENSEFALPIFPMFILLWPHHNAPTGRKSQAGTAFVLTGFVSRFSGSVDCDFNYFGDGCHL